jgi:hypothetical protein
MLQESKTNELEYQRLSKEEMEQRGILGRLVGICADFMSPTRNGRKYPEKLWENVFNDPIMKERIDNGVCYGELGHPADREETDMEKIAVCMAEQPKKGKDGKLRAVFDILNTPNGRILKSLCDYGSTLGISSRGSGDLETDFDGQESVNPDTYNCEGFDVVLIPAVKEARLQYVTESLHLNEGAINPKHKINLEAREFNYTMHYGADSQDIHSAVVVIPNGIKFEDGSTIDATVHCEDVNGKVIDFTSVKEAQEWIDNYGDSCLYYVVNGDELHATPEDAYDIDRAIALESIDLNKKRYNKTLRDKLTESIKKETEEHQKIINESLSALGVDLTEANDRLLSKNDFYFANEKQEFNDKPQELFAVELQKLSKETLEQILDSAPVESKIHNIYDVWQTKHALKDGNTPIESIVEKQQGIKQNYFAPTPTKSYDTYWSVSGREYKIYDLIRIILGKDKYKIVSDGQTFNFDESLKESQYKDNEVQNTASGTIVRDSKGNFVQEFPTDDEATEWIDDQELDESIHLSKDWRTLNIGDDVQWTSHEFDGDITWDCSVKDVYPDHIIICPKDAKFNDMCLWIDDDMLTESLSLAEGKLTPEEKMDMWHSGERRENIKACSDAKLNMYRDICEDNGYDEQVAIIDAELARRNGENATTPPPQRMASVQPAPTPTQSVPTHTVTAPGVPNCFMDDEGLHITADRVGRDFMSQFNNDPDYVEYISNGEFIIQQSDKMANKVADALVKAMDESELSESMIKQNNNDENRDIKPDTADDDGVMVEELQKSLDLNRKLDKKIVDLQEKLSVSYAKEMNLQEELEKYKSKVIKLSRRLAEEKVTNDKLTVIQDKKVIAENTCKQLTESVKTKTAKITSLKESVDKKKEQIVSLNEQIQQLMSALDERNNQFETLTEKYETLNKDYQQVKENYSKKMEQQNALVEKYRGIAVKSVNKYIDTQATRLGISSEEIKNRLPESYSFTDIDRICEDLQEYKLNISNLPFTTSGRLNEGMRIKATNMNQKTLVPVEDDIDDLTLRLAGLK